MYIQKDMQYKYTRNIEVRSRNHFCRGKTIIISNSECVSAAFVTQHAKNMRHIILYRRLWPVHLYHIFHIISQTARFSEKCY